MEDLSEGARSLMQRLAYEPERDVDDIAKNLMQWSAEAVRAAAAELESAHYAACLRPDGEGDASAIMVVRLSDRGRLVARGHGHLAVLLPS